ncbi:3-carboxy-cis,cis-mucoante lactonizing enzyme [Aspergillus avenaceus]|uniref:3-carboxy-cis,cis-mucoante lactonizing enzyme n=1 Tax=Aspergillus avenaceus TaxID=36643 RepID=A0A5N6U4M0_ASPAV|nr:3-carboxy-cis,cis-mucoante lactonizing enzyme [Aspergillus avenaceus]
MKLLGQFLALSLALPALASNIYITHYDGHVYALALDKDGDALKLTEKQALKTCGAMPSWLTLQEESKILWCTDENTPGTLTPLQIGRNGSIKALAEVTTPPGGVNSAIYPAGNKTFLAVAHYGNASISSFEIPFTGNKTIEPAHVHRFNLSPHGPKPGQEQPRPHQVFLDPKKEYIIAPDLGSDRIRIMKIDKKDGRLNQCGEILYPAGVGPRQGVFMDDGSKLYTVSELEGYLCRHDIAYTDSCLGVKGAGICDVPYTNRTLPKGATLSGIQGVGSTIHVSIRNDTQEGGSIATLHTDGKAIGPVKLTGSGGSIPRTFVVNKQGTMLAVANQASSNVVVFARDPKTGQVGKKLAELKVGKEGKVGAAEGISSIVWAE